MKLRWIALFTMLTITLVGCGGGEESTQVEMQQQTEMAQQEQTEATEQQSQVQAETTDPEPEASPEASEEDEENQVPGININTASSSQLQELTGVGPATAESIIAYREESGAFSSLDELDQVSGIGPATIEKIRPDAKLSGPTTVMSSNGDSENDSTGKTEEDVEPSGDVVNINTASAEELQKLDGVGPATAEKIISYREDEGKFSTPSDFQNVSGIGPATFDKNKARIVTE